MAKKDPVRIIATLPPYVEHRPAIIGHPLVDELRFNSISPAAETRSEMLARLKSECGGKKLWIDLKARQLRIAKFAYLPYAFVELNNAIEVDLPAEILFKDGAARIVEIVDGRKLILDSRPPRVVGEGEPVNILDDSLAIRGKFLLDSDREFVEAAKSLGLHDYLLSFVEQPADIAELLELDPEAKIIAKIESRRGLEFVRRGYGRLRPRVRLMAARDDLYINLGAAKADFLPALELIIRADPEAAVASRLLTSLENGPEVSSQDISDLELMLRLGYRTLMLSDGLCFREDPFNGAIAALGDILKVRRRRST